MGYTESIGLLKLRDSISSFYKSEQNFEIPIENIAVTAGASASILLVLMTLFNEGDHIAIAIPGYPCYRNIIKALGLKPYIINTKFRKGFQLEKEEVKKIPSYVKGIIIESPSNPTGAVIDNINLGEILDICKKKKLKVIADEIYHGISYNKEKTRSVLDFDKDCIVINSFSKYFLMTGWRLGWIVAKRNIIESISKLAMNLYLSPASVAQYTALNVFKHYNYFDNVVSEYKTNRDYLATELKKIGLNKFYIPKGAFYLYLNISDLSNNSYKFCQDMVSKISVTAAPGIDFDIKRGNKYIRLSFAGKKSHLSEAIKRLSKWI